MKWSCGIPGKANTIWDPAVYPLTMEFTEDYPSKPPKCSPLPLLYIPALIKLQSHLLHIYYTFITHLLPLHMITHDYTITINTITINTQ
jgi:Ubiquitin-conjugating enzyme